MGRFIRLTVIKLSHKTKPGQYVWLCRCKCGGECVVAGMNVIRNTDKPIMAATTNGLLRNGEWKSWRSMMLLETMSQNELDQARSAIIRVIAAYERAIVDEVFVNDPIIDTSKLAGLRDAISTLRNVLRDIAGAESRLSKQIEAG